jgi:hypothetical protein
VTEDVPAQPRGPVGWGDALTAAHQLGLESDQDLDTLVELLGLRAPEDRPAAVDPALAGAWPGQRNRDRPAPSMAPPPVPDELTALHDSTTVIDPLPDEPVGLDALMLGEALEPSGPGLPAVPYEPPIPSSQLRAAFLMLLGRDRPSDDVDVDAAVDIVAEQRPLTRPPTLVERSVHRGATVLADVGPAMLPYLEDVAHLVREVAYVVGEAAVDLHWVEDGFLRDRLESDLQPGRPVLILSTLGAVRPPGAAPAAQDRWLSLASLAAQAGAAVVAAVPHQGHQWPSAVRSAMRVVAWEDLSQVGRGRD